MGTYTLPSVRTRPYPTDRLIMGSIGRFVPSWITPNHITIARLIGTPYMGWLLLTGRYVGGLVFFLILAFSDALDGAMARTRGAITSWGVVYDPIADKFLIGTAVVIVAVHRLGIALAAVVISLEAVTIIGGLYFKYGRKTLLPANWWGKSKMLLQVTATTLLIIDALLGGSILAPVAFWVFVAASSCAMLSLLSYGA